MKRLSALILTLGLATLEQASAAEALPPASDFFRFPEFSSVALSPSGRYLGAVHTSESGARNLVVMDVSDRSASALTGYDAGGVRSFIWKSDERLMFLSMIDSSEEAMGAGFIRGWRSINVDGSRARRLDNAEFFQIADRMRDTPGRVLGVGEERRGYDALIESNSSNGRRLGYEEGPGAMFQFALDRDGELRAAVNHFPAEFRAALMYREDADSEWQEVKQFAVDVTGFELFLEGFDADDHHLLVRSKIGRDRYALYRLDPTTGELGEPIAEDPVFDIDGVSYSNPHHEGGRVMYAWSRADIPKRYWIDDHWHEIQQMVDVTFPDTMNTLHDISEDGKRVLVRAESSQLPPIFYLLELDPQDQDQPRISYLLNTRSWNKASEMAVTEPIEFQARDGVTIHGYLTMPNGADGPVPLIVNPHGGPYGVRDDWAWSPERQFFASRGWATLQVNFRGSGGYGEDFQTMGYQKWGLEMQDDLSDAVRWAVDRGYTQIGQICIYGASYGGYATLMGLIETPELYECGVDYVGVTSLYDIFYDDTGRTANTLYDTFSKPRLKAWVGDPSEDKERMDRTSPINRVAEIEDPVFVIHGRLDPRVQVDQYHRLIRELEAQGKPHQKVLRRFEGHGFGSSEATDELYGAMEEFLAKYLN